MSIETFIAVVLGGFLCEFVDASTGMMYGTILSPVLLITGFEPVLAGATTFAEASICTAGFLIPWVTKEISVWNRLVFLSIGALFGAFVGALLTSRSKSEKRLSLTLAILAILALIFGIWTLVKTRLL